jgi:hypothetical protein
MPPGQHPRFHHSSVQPGRRPCRRRHDLAIAARGRGSAEGKRDGQQRWLWGAVATSSGETSSSLARVRGFELSGPWSGSTSGSGPLLLVDNSRLR